MARRKKKVVDTPECRTLTEYANIAAVCSSPEIRGEYGAAWAGGTLADARRFAERGDLSGVAEIERRAAVILAPLAEMGEAVNWERSPVGAFPSVPDYLAGSPESMWQRQPIADERAEISVFLPHGGTAKIKAEGLKNYGATVAALLVALSRSYTVRARVYCGTAVRGVIFDLAAPLDLSEIGAALCQPCTFRQGTVGVLAARAHAAGFGNTPVAPWERDAAQTREVLRRYGATDKSVIITVEDVARLSAAEPDEAARYINGILEAVR